MCTAIADETDCIVARLAMTRNKDELVGRLVVCLRVQQDELAESQPWQWNDEVRGCAGRSERSLLSQTLPSHWRLVNQPKVVSEGVISPSGVFR